MHVGKKESTNNAKLLLQLGDPPGWPVTYSDLAPLAVVGSTPSIADGNGGIGSQSGLSTLSSTGFHTQPRTCQHSKGQAPACFHQPGHLVCIVNPGASNRNGSRTKEVTTPKGCPVLFGGSNGMSTGILASLSCADVAQIR